MPKMISVLQNKVNRIAAYVLRHYRPRHDSVGRTEVVSDKRKRGLKNEVQQIKLLPLYWQQAGNL